MNTIHIRGQARLQAHRLGWMSKMCVRLLDVLNVGRIGAQTVGKLINHIISRYGELKWDTGFSSNQITNASLAVFSGLSGNTGSQTAFTYLAVGTSSTATSASHTTLQSEIVDSGLERASATVSRVTTTQTNDTLQLVKAWSVTGTKSVEEVGVFNASSGGVMAGRKLTGTKAVVSGDTLTATYQIIFA